MKYNNKILTLHSSITETWLKETIHDDLINIEKYQLYRQDRKNQEHSGVCLYVADSIRCKILQDFHSDDHEALWAFLRPKRLPRGFFNLIVAVVYHPDQHPDSSNAALSEYLTSTLDRIEVKFPNNGILVAGNFNKLDSAKLQMNVTSSNQSLRSQQIGRAHV